jgi:hypothetical protein
MVARVTLAEIDAVRMSVPAALRLYRESVLPAQHDQPGYEGGYVLSTPEGKALVMTFWATPEDADAGLASGFYGEQVQKFATIFRAAPGRELYDVSLAEPPGSPRSPADGILQPGDGSAPPAGASAPPAGASAPHTG